MQTAVVKKKLVSWCLEHLSCEVSAASGATQIVTTEGYQKLRGAFASPFRFYLRFARVRSSTEQEKCSLRILTKDNLETFKKELNGVG